MVIQKSFYDLLLKKHFLLLLIPSKHHTTSINVGELFIEES